MTYEELQEELILYPDQMTTKERTIAYGRGEPVDRIPLSISVNALRAGLYSYTLGEYRRSFEVRKEVYQKMNRDFSCEGITIGTGLKKIGTALGGKAYYPENAVDYLAGPVFKDYWTDPEFPLTIPDPCSNAVLSELLDEVERYKTAFGSDFPVKTDVGGPMTTASFLCDLMNMLKNYETHPYQLERILTFSVNCQLEWIKVICETYGVTSVSVSDPVATETIWGASLFKRFSYPALKRLCEGIKSITGNARGHICGKSKHLWEFIPEMGYSSFMVDECEDIEELKHKVGDRIAISGNIPPVPVLLQGTIDDVLLSARDCIQKGADSFMGYTLAAGCQIPAGVPIENFFAMLLAAKKYGKGACKGHPCKGV